jgi:iron complex outermembrane recepter protein
MMGDIPVTVTSRSLFWGGAAVLMCCADASTTAAQNAATPDAAVQLPEISVKTAKPIAPKRAAHRSKAKPAPTQVSRAQAPASTSAPAPSPAPQDYAPMTALTSDELQRLPASTLGDALFARPGVTASTFAPGGASRPIIGGLDNFRVRIQENGVASGDVSALGEDHGVPIDPLAAQRLEVIRGPETLRYGGSAVGGVVEASNNRIPDALPPAPGYSVETRGGYSSVDHGFDGAALIDASAGNVAVHGDFFKRNAGDYAIPGGRQANTALTAEGQSIGASLVGLDGYAGVAFTHFASLYHVPGLEAAATNTHIDMEQYKVTSKGEARIKDADIPFSAFRFWLGASDYKHNEIGIGEDGVDGVQATYKDKNQEARAEIDIRPLAAAVGALKGTLGASFTHTEIGTSGDAGNLLAPAETSAAAGYLFEELKITDALRLQAAGRIESIHIDGSSANFPAGFLPPPEDLPLTPESLSFAPKSYSFGVQRDLPAGFVLSGNVRYVERAPDASELFSKGAHDAPKTFEVGDPTLSPETARTAEIGLRRAAGRLRVDSSVYYTEYAGFIFKQFNGNRCNAEFSTCVGPNDPGAASREFDQIVYSQRDATFRGAQIAAHYDLTKLWGGTFGVESQYDFVRATFADGENVPRMPPHRLGGGLFWRDASWFAHVNLLHAFEQTEISAHETSTPGYTLLKAELSYTIRLDPVRTGAREMTLSIVGDNLLDEVVRNSASLRKDEVESPGRGVRLVGSVKF